MISKLKLRSATATKNWSISSSSNDLKNIFKNEINVAIQNRDISHLSNEINNLLKLDINIKLKGNAKTIFKEINNLIDSDVNTLVLKDIEYLLLLFSELTNSQDLHLYLATINTNMCRRFHADNNDLRLLCTYSGPGTIWLTQNNINLKALNSYKSNESIVIDKSKIQQAKTGSVVILKGSKFHKTSNNAAVHKSPSIENLNQKRLLLRLDTDRFLNF